MTLSVVIGLIGVGGLLLGILKVRKVRASRSWIQTTGTIVGPRNEDSPDSYTAIPTPPEVCYEFQVEGRPLRGDGISFDRVGYQKWKDAQAVAARFPLSLRSHRI